MTIMIGATDLANQSCSPSFAPDDRAMFVGTLGAMALASILFRLGGATPDVSWLIEVCIRILNGEKPFVEVFETTPPIPTLIYMPGAAIEKFFGAPAEVVVVCYAALAYLGLVLLCRRILPARIEGVGSCDLYVALPIAVFLFLLTNDCFAQRETFAAAMMAPMLCSIVAYAQTQGLPKPGLRALAIILAGLGAAVKPPLFAAPLILCGGYLVVRDRSLRPIYSSGLLASAFVCAILTAASLAAFPGYMEAVYPLMRDVYVPIKHPIKYGLIAPAFFISALAWAIGHLRTFAARNASEADKIFALAAAGFTIVYFYQAKYFNYHIVPIALFLFPAAWTAVVHALQKRMKNRGDNSEMVRRLCLVVAAFTIAAGYVRTFDDHEPHMRDRSWAASLDHPTAMAIAIGDITGYPLAREIGAVWVNTTHCQWAITYPQSMMDTQRVSEKQQRIFKEYQERELVRVAALVSTKRPQIIIQGTSEITGWLTRRLQEKDPTLLDDYVVVAEEGAFRIWRRKDSFSESPTRHEASAR